LKNINFNPHRRGRQFLKYQILIIGAGIAGLTAALESAKLGFKVAIFEKNKKIGYPLSCGEYIPNHIELKNIFPKAQNFEKLLSYPKEFIRNKCTKVFVHGSSERFWEYKLNSIVINRPELQQYLAEQCLAEGATLYEGYEVKSYNQNGYLNFSNRNNSKLNGEICIAADGPTSRIARNAGLLVPHIPSELSPCKGYIVDNVNLDSDICHVFFSSKFAPGGYGWVIPWSENEANIGVGIRKSFLNTNQNLGMCLKHFIEEHPVASKMIKHSNIIEKIHGLVPIGGPIPVTHTSNLMVIGDAAGFVMACNGGGIPTGVLSGYLAAHAAKKHLTNNKPLEIYEKEWRYQIGDVLKKTIFIRKMADRIMIDDSLMEMLLDLIGSRRLGELMTCRMPFLVKMGSPFVSTFLKLFSDNHLGWG
jgi:digeranylgeranylglycerophospholipid reductase